ncbi:hypothetical protein OKA04_10000 [Luteolibacter flavescens]|uniref:HEAT repeat domain-containing protein n=1 Tax=Luteolibacter flavescens TaxID=1859460 RepID=A0ABT3FNY5_9BACT|nr:hypothetical protein [Luteolibacter flavescens]MCW1885059.1 hypothetical protein [Luteolibacter flavescens]
MSSLPSFRRIYRDSISSLPPPLLDEVIRMTDMAPSSELPAYLYLRPHTDEVLADEDLSIIQQYLKTDPKVRPLLLDRVEFSQRYDQFFEAEHTMLRMLLEAFPDCQTARHLLRWGAFVNFGFEGRCGGPCHELMKRFFADDPYLRQIVIRSARASTWSFGHRDAPPEDWATDMATDAGDTIATWALDDPSIIPLLVACGTVHPTESKHIIAALACQTHTPLEPFDLGGLAEPVAEVRRHLGSTSDPILRHKLAAIAIHDGRDYLLNTHLPRELSDCDVELLMRKAAELAGTNLNSVVERLAKAADSREDLRSWLSSRCTIAPEHSPWTRNIIRHSGNRELVMDAMAALLSTHDPISFRFACEGIERLVASPWKLPQDEGMALIDRALQLPHTCGSEEYPLWQAFVAAYPEQARTRHELLSRLPEISTSTGASLLMQSMIQHGVFREELVDLVNRRVEGLLADLSDITDSDPCLACICSGWVRSPTVFDLLVKIAREAKTLPIRKLAIQTLADHFRDYPRIVDQLLEFTSDTDKGFCNAAWNALAHYFPTDPKLMDRLQKIKTPPANCASALLQEWLEGRPHRTPGTASHREYLIQRLAEEWRCSFPAAHFLAAEFGDHEETLPMFLRIIRCSTTGPDVEQFSFPNGFDKYEWERKGPEFLANCLKILVIRWPEDERVLQLAKETIDHPWIEVREEAARSLARAYPDDSDVPSLLAPHLGESHVIFAEYAALMTGRPGGLATALSVLERLEQDPATEILAFDGPLYLVRYFGPLKSLGRDLRSLASRTENSALKEGIDCVINRFFPSIGEG